MFLQKNGGKEKIPTQKIQSSLRNPAENFFCIFLNFNNGSISISGDRKLVSSAAHLSFRPFFFLHKILPAEALREMNYVGVEWIQNLNY